MCVNGEHFDEDLAKQAVSEMINAGGTTGEKWSKERTDEAARIVSITENLWDFSALQFAKMYCWRNTCFK